MATSLGWVSHGCVLIAPSPRLPSSANSATSKGWSRSSTQSSVDNRSTVDDRDRSVAPVPDWSQIPAEDRYQRTRDQAAGHPGPRTSNAGIGSRRGSAVPRVGTRLDDGDDGSEERRSSWWVSTCRRRCCGTTRPSHRWRRILAEMLAPQQVPQEDDADLTLDSASSVLDELFDSVESASAGSESGI